MISIVITSYKEPETIRKAIDSFISQKIKEKYELIVSAPDSETLDVARQYAKKNSKIKIFQDPGKGKSYALNIVLKKVKGRIIILSDGDVYVSKNSVNSLIDAFNDKKVACASGRPVSQEKKETLLGYWSHMLCDAGAHKLRTRRAEEEKFLECSGYLWALRSNLIDSFPLDVAEDSIVPALLWKKGYKIKYVPEAVVYVSYPKNIRDYLAQKKRTIKSHEKLKKYSGDIPRMKSFKNELLGAIDILSYSSNIKEFFYTILAFPVRLFLWILAYLQYLFKKEYSDAWKRVESTK